MSRSSMHSFRIALVGCTALWAIASAASAQAQSEETVTVTATRLNAAGFNAPTPTTVVGTDLLQTINQPEVFDAVGQMPAMISNSNALTGTHGTSSGDNGLDNFNMFGLGIQRTLTLLDGQRFVWANSEGVSDIQQFPNLLVQRVDVVTGGASASWGSDAMAGVVNFITDKKFEGFKGEFSGGATTYGDNVTLHAGLAAGTSFLGGRGHFELSVEYDHNDGLPGGQYGLYNLQGGRKWYHGQRLLAYPSPSATPAGQPQYIAAYQVQDNQRALYGLINSGPLMGTAFAANGTPYQFQYGKGPTGLQGVPNLNGTNHSSGTVSNCVASFCIGGDLGGDIGNGIGLMQARTRGDFYDRLSYDVDSDTNLYITTNFSDVGTQAVSFPSSSFNSLPGVGTNTVGQVVQLPGIQCGTGPTAAQLPAGDLSGPNAYLPASINAACAADRITSFNYGDTLGGVTGPNWVRTDRVSWRVAAGGDGVFHIANRDWTWSSYFTHGQTRTADNIGPIALNPYLYAAIDAVAAQAGDGSGAAPGTIVCRNATARAEGCVPIDLFGGTPLTTAQQHWIFGGNNWDGMHRNIQDLWEDAVSFSINGTPFSLWAGKLATAAGIEYRQEGMNLSADGASQGATAAGNGTPAVACNDALLNCVNGNNWYAGNFRNGHGNFHVSEGFVELGVPLVDNTTVGTADLDLAGRYELYSPAGDFLTWKVGLNWDTPLTGLRMRTLMSRDVHAPSLNDLFAPSTTNKTSIVDPWTGTTVDTLQQRGGNPFLKPERATNTQLGFVYQPDWLSGFMFSADYYRYYIAAAIGSVNFQTVVNNCFNGIAQYCKAIAVSGGGSPATNSNWAYVIASSFNVSSLVTDGFTYQTTYNFDMNNVGLPGGMLLRAFATNVSKYVLTQGTPGSFPVELAGANDWNDFLGHNPESIPHWLIQAYQTYNFDPSGPLGVTNITLSERIISSGKHDNNAVQCVPGNCPVSTSQFYTVNDNHVPGIIYFNLGVSHNLSDSLQAYLQVNNLLDKDPPPMFATNYNSRPYNWQLYDGLGRMVMVGIRYNN